LGTYNSKQGEEKRQAQGERGNKSETRDPVGVELIGKVKFFERKGRRGGGEKVQKRHAPIAALVQNKSAQGMEGVLQRMVE